jgi:hypothetical protein
MSDKLEQVRTQLHANLDAAVDGLQATRAHLQAKTDAAQADTRAKLEASKAKVAGMKQQAAAARARMSDLINAKAVETDAQVAEWQAKRQHDKLVKRAEQAEDYAVACVAVTMAMAAEADLAVLEAAQARMDADQGATA